MSAIDREFNVLRGMCSCPRDDEAVEEAEQELKRMRGLLLWALYHHQGATSPIGQPIRKLLGIGEHENMTHEQVVEAQIAAGIR